MGMFGKLILIWSVSQKQAVRQRYTCYASPRGQLIKANGTTLVPMMAWCSGIMRLSLIPILTWATGSYSSLLVRICFLLEPRIWLHTTESKIIYNVDSERRRYCDCWCRRYWADGNNIPVHLLWLLIIIISMWSSIRSEGWALRYRHQ